MLLEAAPAADGVAGDGGAGGRAFGCSGETAIVPRQAEDVDEPAEYALRLGGEIFIGDVVDRRRQHGAPVAHQPLVLTDEAGDLAELVQRRAAFGHAVQ